jgi:hypothetical protein
MRLFIQSAYCFIPVTFVVFLASCAGAYRIEQDDIARSAVGRITWREWQREAQWTRYIDSTYTPDAATSQRLQSLLQSQPTVSFRLIAATWCSDSRDELPRLFSLFERLGTSADAVELWGVDRRKRQPEAVCRENALEYVPTLVVLRGGKEVGRVVEHPRTSWEADIVGILEK